MRIAALLICLLLLPAPLAAQATAAPGLPPLAVGEAQRWPAVGRVNGAGYRTMSHCTGTLVAPDLVLTAAHCTPAPGKPPERIFVAGYLRGDYAAAVPVARGERHPAYLSSRPHDPRFDIGLLFLESPITTVRPLPLAEASADALGLIGYHRARPHMLSGRFDCPVLATSLQTLQLGCEVISGNSGGPVLQRGPDGTWALVAVVSSTYQGTALATRLPGWVVETVARHNRPLPTDAD